MTASVNPDRITFSSPDDLRSSLAGEEDAARATFIEESGDRLVGGFVHGVKGDEWLVRRLDGDVYLVTGSEFERRYDEGLIYDVHITPRLIAAYEEGLLAKVAAMSGAVVQPDDPLARSLIAGARTRVCDAWCLPGRRDKVIATMVDDDEWEAVREVIARAQAGS